MEEFACYDKAPEGIFRGLDKITKFQRSKLGFFVPFDSQGHIGTGPQHCHLWDSNSQM